MARYFRKLVAMALAVSLPFFLFFGALFALPDHRGGSIAATIRYKTQLLQTTVGPRILFAGGSSSPYGTICAEVERQLGRSAICVGATAYLGIPFYLSLLETYAQTGDVIVLAPEHSLLTSEAIDYTLVWEAAGQEPDVWRCMPLSYLPGLFSSGVSYFKLKWSVLDEPSADYHVDFGPLGDVVTPREALLSAGYLPDDPVDLSPERIYLTNIEQINRFAEKMARRGVTVVFAFAPLDELAVTSSAEETAAFGRAVTEALEIPVILDLPTALLPGAYFYDSNNHLTSAGAQINTQNLIDGLREVLADEAE